MTLSLTESAAEGTFERLLENLSMHDRSLRLPRLHDAFAMAQKHYGERRLRTGDTLITHVLGVLELLLPFRPDEDAIIGCLLQHMLDEHDRTLDAVQELFGNTVRSIVSGVHLLSHVTMRNKRMSIDQLRLMFLRVSDDSRVILITLCSHCFALDHISAMSMEEGRRFCHDTLTLFSPVAARLGIYSLKNMMEARSFLVAYPTDSERIDEQLEDLHTRYGDFLPSAIAHIEQFLAESGVTARVEAREKSSYSIFQKMQTKSVGHVEELYDLFAIRVIVQEETSCYQILGLLHRIGHPVPHRFKDYIAFPKPNGYQSLHTTLAKLPGMPEKLRVEVQIRTEAMHREAEYGIAAHWNYKETGDVRTKDRLSRAVAFERAIERGKAVLTDHIFVLTPKGDIVELPDGATPLDFAFQVHTNLGISFRAARVNGNIVSLTHQLENGDIVEILRYREPKPSSRWAELLKTASARSRLKKYLQEQQYPAHMALGREFVNQELHKRKRPPLDPDLSLLRIVGGIKLDQEAREDLLVKVGQGGLKASDLLNQAQVKDETAVPVPRRKGQPKVITVPSLPSVQSEIPMPMRFAKCCKPETSARGPIIGIVSRLGEIKVHSQQCALIKAGNVGRRVKVRWVA